MSDVRVRELLSQQLEIISWWQLEALGWSPRRIDYWARCLNWQVVHRGVFAAQHAPLRREQRWIAATLTAPATLLFGPSAGAAWGFAPWEGPCETLVRWGCGGPEVKDGLRVFRSLALADDVAWLGPIPLTSAERTLIDLACTLSDFEWERAAREAVRMRLVTTATLLETVYRHQGRRGTKRVRLWAERYARPGATRERRGYHIPGAQSGRSRWISPVRAAIAGGPR